MWHRCGRDGIEAATAAAAAVRVEAEAKCRDLSKRIDSLSRPREDTGRVQEWHGEDLQSLERRLRSQLEQRMDEASESIAAELKAEVQMELAAFRQDLSLSRPSPGKHERADSALERRLITAEEDLRRAVHGVAELENRVQGEERVYWTVVQALEQRVGSLEACSNQLSVEDRMGKLEAQIARLLDRVAPGSPQPRQPPSVMQDPAVRRPRGVLASMALASDLTESQAEVNQAPRLQQPERAERLVERHVERHVEPRREPAEGAAEAEVVSPPPASPASSSSAPSPHLRGVPLQPPVRRPSRLIPGSLRLGSSEPEDPGKSGRPSTTQRPVPMAASQDGDVADVQSQRLGTESHGGSKAEARRRNVQEKKLKLEEMLQTAAAASKAASTATMKRRIRQRLHKKLGSVFSKKDFAVAMERFKLLEAEDEEDREPKPVESSEATGF
eukprot:s1275_g3.t2